MMKKRIAALVFSAIVVFTGHSVFSSEKIVFQDNFSNNDSQWAERNTSEVFLQVSNGRYVIEHKRTEYGWFSWKAVVIDQKKDFKIESIIEHREGVDNYGYGIFWGGSDLDNYFTFNITDNGSFRFAKEEAGTWVNIIDWTSNSAIRNGNKINTLSVVKEGTRYYFYVNDILLQSSYFEPFFGDNLGFAIWRNQHIEIDNLMVVELDKDAERDIISSRNGKLRNVKYKTAVVEFSELGDLEIPDGGKIVSDWLSTALNNTMVFEVYERISLAKLLDEQKLQLSGIVDEETIAQIGKMHGVEAIVTGNISKFGRVYSITVKLVDVENAKIIDSSSITTNSIDEIPPMIEKIAMDLATE